MLSTSTLALAFISSPALKLFDARIYDMETSMLHKLCAIHAAISATCGMEFYSRHYHRYTWHNKASTLFDIHQTHHTKKSVNHYWEKNDVLGILNFFVVIGPLIWSSQQLPTFGSTALLGLCIGISIFGTCYMIVHDGVCHRRFPVFGLHRIPFIQSIAKAHAQHHTSDQGAPYGLFLGPQELAAHANGHQPSHMPWYLKYSLVLSTSIAVFGLLSGY